MPNADPLLAVIRNGAWVAIHALALLERQELAPGFSQARVVGALVVVVAGQFIHVAVAIIVNPVAFFKRGQRRVAVAKSVLEADALALTQAPLVFGLAWRP